MTTSMRDILGVRGLRALAAASAVLAALPAVAEDKVQLQLNWFHLADHSPIYLAMKKGYYKEAGDAQFGCRVRHPSRISAGASGTSVTETAK